MAILKHITIKNADYGAAQRYLVFQHDEYTNTPILDESGRLIPRREYYLDGVNCDPFHFDDECMELNARYKKNQKKAEIKSHHYIISFDPEDVTKSGLTGEKAQQLGLEYAKKYFPGHQALVCTHTDGHNESGNIHIHIIINSLRKYDVEQQNYMQFPCENRAGYKHHLSKEYLAYLKQAVMEMCKRENLHQVDLLTPAEKRITEKEYHAKRRGQKKLNERNRQMLSGGIAPRKTVYQTQKDDLRAAIDEAANASQSLEEFQNHLMEKYRISLKISRGRFSYLYPDRQKAITGRMLGSCYERDYLQKRLKENAERKIEHAAQNRPSVTVRHPASPFQHDTGEPFLFIKSDLRLVADLQQCVKAQQNQAYARRVKLSNLQQMARTISYVQEHGFDTRQDLMAALEDSQSQAGDMRKALRTTEQRLRDVNEQIHYTGQYLANKNVYSQYLKSRNKKRFRQEHQTEIALYETAQKFLKEKSGTDRLPSMKSLKEEKEKLTRLKDSQYAAYQNLREYHGELKTVCSNVDMILGNSRSQQMIQQKSQDIS